MRNIFSHLEYLKPKKTKAIQNNLIYSGIPFNALKVPLFCKTYSGTKYYYYRDLSEILKSTKVILMQQLKEKILTPLIKKKKQKHNNWIK